MSLQMDPSSPNTGVPRSSSTSTACRGPRLASTGAVRINVRGLRPVCAARSRSDSSQQLFVLHD
eukprot:14384055-Heterocapsa_arctica.AAC.1